MKAVGGTAGVGVTFLEETFSAATASPEHRYHQKAARAESQCAFARYRDVAGWAGETNVGTPIEGMLVELFHPGDKTPIATTRTNEEGGFRFTGLAPGRYVLKASGVVENGADANVRLDPAAKAQLCLVVE